MATTANFGWTKPTVGGDVGAWGTILNTLFDAVDAALFKIYAEDLAFPPFYAAACGAITENSTGGAENRTFLNFGISPSGIGVGVAKAAIPILGLAAGMRITTIAFRGGASTGQSGTLTAQLKRIDNAGTITAIGAGVTLNQASGATQTVSEAVNHDIVADALYYAEFIFTTNGGPTQGASFIFVDPTVTRP